MRLGPRRRLNQPLGPTQVPHAQHGISICSEGRAGPAAVLISEGRVFTLRRRSKAAWTAPTRWDVQGAGSAGRSAESNAHAICCGSGPARTPALSAILGRNGAKWVACGFRTGMRHRMTPRPFSVPGCLRRPTDVICLHCVHVAEGGMLGDPAYQTREARRREPWTNNERGRICHCVVSSVGYVSGPASAMQQGSWMRGRGRQQTYGHRHRHGGVNA